MVSYKTTLLCSHNHSCNLSIILATSSVFTTHPQDQFIYNNEDAVFECAANGSESLTISWIKDNKFVSNSKSNKIQNDGTKSVLKVKKVTMDNSGIYWCIATNADNEEVSSKPAELFSKIAIL